MSLLTPQKAGTLKKGGYIQIKGHPCKIAEMSTSKTGKHGHAKMNIVGIDVLTGKKYEEMTPTSHNVDAPVVSRDEFQVVGLDSDYLSLMDGNGNMKDDVRIPEDPTLVARIREGMDAGDKDVWVAVLSAPEGEKAESCELRQLVVDVRYIN